MFLMISQPKLSLPNVSAYNEITYIACYGWKDGTYIHELYCGILALLISVLLYIQKRERNTGLISVDDIQKLFDNNTLHQSK